MPPPDEMRVRLSKALAFNFHSPSVLADGLRVWIGGESGSGKTSCAALIAAQVIEKGGQVVVIDPHGEYGDLWSMDPANVVRIGYGSDPVRQESIEWCLSIIEEGKSVLVDLAHWCLEPTELDTFVLEFMRGLFKLRMRQPKFTLLLIEEAQNFAPQMQASGQAENVRVFIKITTEGRKFGLQSLFTTQRQSLVDSSVLANCNVRIFLRTSEFKDWKRIRQYIPDTLNLSFNEEGTGIRSFNSGEAVVLSRWTPDARVHLLEPPIKLRRAEL